MVDAVGICESRVIDGSQERVQRKEREASASKSPTKLFCSISPPRCHHQIRREQCELRETKAFFVGTCRSFFFPPVFIVF